MCGHAILLIESKLTSRTIPLELLLVPQELSGVKEAAPLAVIPSLTISYAHYTDTHCRWNEVIL